MATVLFFSEDTTFKPKQKSAIRQWIEGCISAEGFKAKELNMIFCSDAYLLEMNRAYLNHDTYTDIITFDHSEEEKEIIGDLFISIDRIRENAAKFGVSEVDELHRVIIHGILHLLGYGDKSKQAKAQMRDRENHYLGLRKF